MYRLRKISEYSILPKIGKYYEDGLAFYWLDWFFVLKLPASEKIVPTINYRVGMKKIKDKFYCFETIKGVDYSFADDTEEGAKKKMIQQIKKLFSVDGRLVVTLEIKYKI